MIRYNRVDNGERVRVATESSGALAIVESTAEPAFVTDSNRTIIAWNEAARRLLGYPATEACGAICYSLLAGHDMFGNRYCGPHCPPFEMANRNEAVGCFEIVLRTASGDSSRARVSVVAVPDGRPSDRNMVHILHPVELPSEGDGTRSGRTRNSDRFDSQTPREAEVLELMADGKSTREIADSLYISVATVRHHVQSILRKLDVHSRIEAVAMLHQFRSG